MDDARQKAILKIISLAEMTVENGCTQAEQDSAETIALRLIDRYGLSLDEVERAAEQQYGRRQPQARRPAPPAWPPPFAYTYTITITFR